MLGILFLLYNSELSLFDAKVFAIAESALFSGTKYFAVTDNNILDEIASILLILGALFIAFSKEKSEDEFIAKIRVESLVWATYVNYAILLLAVLFIYDLSFLWVFVFNMFTLLLFFLVRFNWALYKSKKSISDEE